jgi:hypothetical protein
MFCLINNLNKKKNNFNGLKTVFFLKNKQFTSFNLNKNSF